MLLFIVETESDTRARVMNIYHDSSKLSAEIIAKGILVDSLLASVSQSRKDPVLYINPQTKEQWYEYVDRPATVEETVSDVSGELAVLKVLVMYIIPKWSKNTAYEKKDIVRLNNGGIYQCLVAHTSTDATKPTIYPTNWTLLIQLS